MTKPNYRFGLDVGTNSLGWSVLALDENRDPCAIVAAGSRIFPEGREAKKKATLAADRRAARSARRRRDRYKQRQKFLIHELTKSGLFPQSEVDRKQLQEKNPLKLRAGALGERLAPWDVGRALFHLNQRRGFKSNRKDRSEEGTQGVVSRSARLLLEQMGLIGSELPAEQYKQLPAPEKKRVRQQEAEARRTALQKLAENDNLTYGWFLWRRQSAGQPTRARPGAGGDGKLFEVYPTRELYEDEFDKIWRLQAKHHPEIMTEHARQRIHQAIFHQRPLKPQKRGKCVYMSAEDRTFRAMPSFQRYRIYQEVHNLAWSDGQKTYRVFDFPEARDAIVRLLERVSAKSGQVTFKTMKKELTGRGIAEGSFKFNFETEKRKGFEGNRTSNLMQHEDRIGPTWHDWSLEKQDRFIDAILAGTPRQQERDRRLLEGGKNSAPQDGASDDEAVREYLQNEFDLERQTADACMNAQLKDDTANVSLQAARLVLEKMRDGVVNTETGEISLPLQSDAASAVAREVSAFADPMRTRGDDGEYQLLERLPYYGEVFSDGRHIIPGTGNPHDDDKTRWGGVTNPTVHIALNQIRLVVNELIDRFGRPESIAIELGRELPAGADKRREIEKEQGDNQKRNEKYDRTLNEHGQLTNRDNRLRLFLWHQLSDDPAGRCCPFSGRRICISDLFNGSTEIEHLIPFSRSLDDSRANKVLCTRQANRDKANRTPHEAFGASPGSYDWDQIVARAEDMPASKRWRFQPNAIEIWERGNDFTSRHLNDTRYIGRLTREYLESICAIDKIDVLTGRLTSLLRHHWGLNSVLDVSGSKNRDDHRHHAVDAIVIAMTCRSLLQKVATSARQHEQSNNGSAIDLRKLFPKADGGRSAIDPWSGFRDDVAETMKTVVVSHKARRKKLGPGTTDGKLHNDTACGIVEECGNGKYEVVSRKAVEDFKTLKTIESIRDPRLRKAFREEFKEAEERESGTGFKAVQELAQRRNIRSLRLVETMRVILVTEHGSEKPYKAYKRDSNWGVEIYSRPAGQKKADKWQGEVIPRFDANKKGFKRGETFRPHPAARLVMCLQINDCVQMQSSRVDDTRKLYRLQKVSSPDELKFAEIHEANVDKRSRNGDFSYTTRTASGMKSCKARKVHISPTGCVSIEQRRPTRRRK